VSYPAPDTSGADADHVSAARRERSPNAPVRTGIARRAMPGLSWQRIFPGSPEQVAVLRRWITSLLPDCPSREDLVLVASELAGNTIRHTASGQGGTFAVQVIWGGDTVAVAVDDAGAPGEPQVVDDPLSEGGRGLLVVRELSARMSVSGTDAGRQVCAEIPWHDPAAPVTGRAYLGSRFGVPAWYGSCTRQWWALACGQLLSATSVPELAVLIARSGLAGPAPPRGPRPPLQGRLPASGPGQHRPGPRAGHQAA
jgi:anti-sigma regulatory factor (Ser/Thr protein kinase)